MTFFKKILFILLAFLLLFAGLWLVVVNDQDVSLNLLVFATPHVNVGIVVLLSFVFGALLGVLAGFNLFSLLKLNTRLYWLKREVRQLQDALGDKRYR
ncbi:MAG: LapA family protein [Pedobacter sp.]|nr:LapA family protein [Pedobacter sp.]